VNIPAFDPPIEMGAAAPFWDAIAASQLRLPKCSVCQTWQWYPDDSGTCCTGGVLVWTAVVGTGVVHTFTRVRRAFLPGGADRVPFVVAFIELDDVPGVRLVSNVDFEDIAINDRVRVTFRTINGRQHPVFVRA
jgi:uncharacterized protein